MYEVSQEKTKLFNQTIKSKKVWTLGSDFNS